jgi:hypothetical protein
LAVLGGTQAHLELNQRRHFPVEGLRPDAAGGADQRLEIPPHVIGRGGKAEVVLWHAPSAVESPAGDHEGMPDNAAPSVKLEIIGDRGLAVPVDALLPRKGWSQINDEGKDAKNRQY